MEIAEHFSAGNIIVNMEHECPALPDIGIRRRGKSHEVIFPGGRIRFFLNAPPGEEQLKADVTPFNVGDTIKVHTRVIEGGKERIQIFQGIVIAKRGSGINEAFTVRKISYGEGVERVFPLHTPRIAKIEVVIRGKVRRAKLHYLRGRIGKDAMIVKSATR